MTLKTSQDPVLGRPREFDEDEVLSRMMGVFWEKGYEGTSMSDLMSASGLQKGSLYAAFGKKHDVYLKAMALYQREVVHNAVGLLTGAASPVVRLTQFLALPAKSRFDDGNLKGCFLCNAALDYATYNDDALRLVQNGFAQIRRALMVALSEGWPESPKDSHRHYAEFLLVSYSGLHVHARMAARRTGLSSAQEMAMRAVHNGLRQD